MSTYQKFTAEELSGIDKADDLKISPFRGDSKTYGTPTWIWEVVVDGELYVRAYNGTASRWFKSAIAQKEGRIYAAGMTRDVGFEPVNSPDVLSAIDEAYRKKYSKSPYMSHMIDDSAKSATIKISPQL